ncbi:LysR family transcriptional regulator [Sulfitobacter sp. F26204]|uniref:LysR family transcriptional regulator n=1 Tax=Sulfitobacter sp. F26204 TaxID=2996014 RepID=UPI00225E4136|nr:LysR family transcriptional regulator [Sulfitobacter sp. F26204]MCX7559151.1 LysR family transcriptional regulator [Sulfitobacter sp. F26204]
MDHIPAFHAVMRHGSLSAAARALRLAQPTVRRHIEALESDIGAALFTRAANGLTPTELAQTLYPMAQAVLEQAAAMHRAATTTADTLGGVVRITTSRIVATHVLPPVLATLRTRTPGLRFEIAATDQAENLAQRAADIAIRFTPPRQQMMVAQSLSPVDIGLFAAPGFPAPQTVEEITTIPFIADDREDLILPGLIAAGVAPPGCLVVRCDDPLAQIAHIVEGLGVGVCQAKLAARLGLVRVLPEISYKMPIWLVVHEDQAHVARIRRVFDHLKTHLPAVM